MKFLFKYICTNKNNVVTLRHQNNQQTSRGRRIKSANKDMEECKLFSTRKKAEAYIKEEYPEATIKSTTITDEDCPNMEDYPNFTYSGETAAFEVLGNDCNVIAVIGWWEDGTEDYTLYRADGSTSHFDCRLAAEEEARKEQEKAQDMIDYEEGTPSEVKIVTSDGEVCDF